MAAINTTFGFKDQITQNLSLLNQTLTSMNKTLAAMQGQMSGVNTGMDNVSKSAQKTADKVGGLSTKFLNFNMAVQAFHTIKGAIDSVGESISECSSLYNFQIAQETKLESVMRSRMKATDETIQSIKNFASEQQKIGVIGDEVQLAGAQELATYLDNAENLKTLLPMLNNLAIQASADGNVSSQLETSLATMVGKVMEGNLSGMSRRGWKFTEAEQAAFKQMNETQRANFLANYAKDAIGNQNEDFAKTAQGQMIQVQNQIGDLKEEVGRAILPFTQLKAIVTGNWKISFYENIVKALNFMTKNIDKVIFALGALGVAVIAAAGAFIALHWASISAAIASTVAWLAALGPIGLIIAAVVALLGILSYFIGVTNVLGAVFGGVFGFIKTTIVDTFKMAYNLVVPILNGFVALGEFFYNIWKHPIDSLKGLFYGLVDTLLGMLGGLGSVFDAILGTSLTTKVQNLRNELEEAKKAAVSGDYKSFKRLELMQTEGIVQGTISGGKNGIDFLKNIENTVKGYKDGLKVEQGGMTFGSDGSLKTSDSSLVDIADDYKELLSARARERFNLKFSQITPQITIENVEVNGDGDLADASFTALADGLEEFADSNARGVA